MRVVMLPTCGLCFSAVDVRNSMEIMGVIEFCCSRKPGNHTTTAEASQAEFSVPVWYSCIVWVFPLCCRGLQHVFPGSHRFCVRQLSLRSQQVVGAAGGLVTFELTKKLEADEGIFSEDKRMYSIIKQQKQIPVHQGTQGRNVGTATTIPPVRSNNRTAAQTPPSGCRPCDAQ